MAGQGYAFTSHKADGVQTHFGFVFVGVPPGFFSVKDIQVFIRQPSGNPEIPDEWLPYTDWTLSGFDTVILQAPPPVVYDPYDDVLVRRIMPRDLPYAEYDTDTIFSKHTLNHSFLQQLYLQHEIIDGMGEDLGVGGGLVINTHLDMRNFRVTNMAAAQDFFDAVRKLEFDELEDRVTGVEGAVGTNRRGPLTISTEPPSGIPADKAEWVMIGNVAGGIGAPDPGT